MGAQLVVKCFLAYTFLELGLPFSRLDFIHKAHREVELAAVLRTDLHVQKVRLPLAERVEVLVLLSYHVERLVGGSWVERHPVMVAVEPNVLIFVDALLPVDRTRNVTLVSVGIERYLDPERTLVPLGRNFVIVKVHRLDLTGDQTARKQLDLLRCL